MYREPHVLIVDDRAEARALVAGDLSDAGFRVAEAVDGADAWRRFRREEPDLVVTDLRMPRADGIELLRRIRGVSAVPVFLLTAYGDVPTAVAAIKGGAQEVFHFPDELERMVEQARDLAKRKSARGERLERAVAGRSAAMRRVRERIRALAPLRVPVLVTGEPGSGRDCVVRALHAHGADAALPLAGVRAGVAPPARRSVVHLDDVAALGPTEQAHWLALIREPERAERARVARVFASTAEDLPARVRDGAFDAGLAERLARFTIALPPLRERLEDLADLVPLLAERLGRQMGRERARFERPALALLRAQPWHENVRELAGVVEKLVAFSPSGAITRERVREVLRESPDSVSSLRNRRSRRQREELVALLEECGGNFAEVARRLEISRGAVIYRAQKHGLVPKPR